MMYDIKKGHLGTVYLNGKHVKATRCRTGVKGFCIVFCKDNGQYVMNASGENVKMQKIKGRVQFIPKVRQ